MLAITGIVLLITILIALVLEMPKFLQKLIWKFGDWLDSKIHWKGGAAISEEGLLQEEKTTPVPFADFALNKTFKCLICKKESEITPCEVVFCSYCRTPHHRYCYDSIGCCSVYSCRGQADPQYYKTCGHREGEC